MSRLFVNPLPLIRHIPLWFLIVRTYLQTLGSYLEIFKRNGSFQPQFKELVDDFLGAGQSVSAWLYRFTFHLRENKLYRSCLDEMFALAWELPFPRCLLTCLGFSLIFGEGSQINYDFFISTFCQYLVILGYHDE